jgi:hypothetical protein
VCVCVCERERGRPQVRRQATPRQPPAHCRPPTPPGGLVLQPDGGPNTHQRAATVLLQADQAADSTNAAQLVRAAAGEAAAASAWIRLRIRLPPSKSSASSGGANFNKPHRPLAGGDTGDGDGDDDGDGGGAAPASR